MTRTWSARSGLIVLLCTVGCQGLAYYAGDDGFTVWSWAATVIGFVVGVIIATAVNRYDRQQQRRRCLR